MVIAATLGGGNNLLNPRTIRDYLLRGSGDLISIGSSAAAAAPGSEPASRVRLPHGSVQAQSPPSFAYYFLPGGVLDADAIPIILSTGQKQLSGYIDSLPKVRKIATLGRRSSSFNKIPI